MYLTLFNTVSSVASQIPLVSEDAWIGPRIVATSALAVRRSNPRLDLIHTRLVRSHPHSARSHQKSARSHPHSARSHPLSARVSFTDIVPVRYAVSDKKIT
jgi:hypothetical protein